MLNILRSHAYRKITFDGERDHVHLLVNYPPKVSISKLVNSLKGVSSRILRRGFEKEISKMLYKGGLGHPVILPADVVEPLLK